MDNQLPIGQEVSKITLEQKNKIIEMIAKDNNLRKVQKYLGITAAAVRHKLNKRMKLNYDFEFEDAVIEGAMQYKENNLNDLRDAAIDENKKYEFYKLKADKTNSWSVCNNSISCSGDEAYEYDHDKPFNTLNNIIRGLYEKKIDRQDALVMAQIIKDSYAVKEVETEYV